MNKRTYTFLLLLFSACFTYGQNISFGSSGLVGETVLNPTSLEFGPDGRLYISQQNGLILAYTIERDAASPGNGTYTITNTEHITKVKEGIPNHDDFGGPNPTQQRLVTGILTAGTPENPILFVNSSDYLLGGGASGNDSNLDTNSGILSRLTWTGTEWHKVDLIRGLPRCEENHALEGIDMFEKDGNTYLLITVGGNTNKGAPSNNFAGTPEYMLSGSVLIVNLTQLESMPIYLDPRTGTEYVYDLPTLNDPTRIDIDNTHPEFPYPMGHPMYNSTIDIGDPFGGNNSLNQAFAEPGGPLQTFAPGFRNAYDVVVTESGKIYLSDNGPNSLWGGLPKIYDAATDTYLGDESTLTYDPLNHYITNEFNESGSSLHGDPLHYVGTINDANSTYYGGHPIPILAFPSRAKVIAYEPFEGSWIVSNTDPAEQLLENLLDNVGGYFNASFNISDFPDDARLGEYLLDEPIGSPKVNILDIVGSSTNGITEYTATNFGGIMQGNILTASFNGDINRYVLNASGDTVLEHEVTFSGFGSIPLDITSQGDLDIFPGTVWAATYGSNAITVFEPTDIECFLPGDPEYDPMADYDGDGYTNQDEIDNGKNICSQSSKPNDNDGDFISDLNDDDDDNDGILDINDAFAIDPDNGLTTNLPVSYPFWNNDPGTGMFGLGFTGLMLDPTGNTDYLTQFNEGDLSFGGAAGKATLDIVTSGDAFEVNNDQQNAFQFGINVDTNSNPFTIQSKIESPFFGIAGSQTEPIDFQSYGISVGNGDQDNYLKVVLMNGISNADTEFGLQVLLEDTGVITHNTSYDIANILDASSIQLYIAIDPANNTAQPFYSIDAGATLTLLGSPITLPISFLDATDNKGLAVSLISTSRAPSGSNPFTATWDYIEVTENQNGVLSVEPNPIDFGLTPVNNNTRRLYASLNNEGGPTDDIITVTNIAFTGDDSSLFSTTITLPFDVNPSQSIQIPIDFTSDMLLGSKTAQLEITHSGSVTPITIDVLGELTDIFTPIFRMNTGGSEVLASDGGPNWIENIVNGSVTGDGYAITSGSTFTINPNSLQNYSNRDSSIPPYIDENTYEELMHSQRGQSATTDQMIFTVIVPNGEYIVNYYGANIYQGTSLPNERIFSVDIENERRIQDLDLSAKFGHRIGGMIQHNVTVTDGELELKFLRNIENPLINALEILGVQYPIINVNPVSNIVSCEYNTSDFGIAASGGNPADNFTYEISGQPLGVNIEPTNGLVFGNIDASAVNGGPNSDGIHEVTVTVSKPGSLPKSVNFTWTVLDDVTPPEITCPNDIIQTIPLSESEANITILNPTASDNCNENTVSFSGVRSDGLELTDPYPLGDTIITWTATDDSGNDSATCDQTITVEVNSFQLDITVSLQGRTDYSDDYSIIIYNVNDLATPIYNEIHTADTLGNIILNNEITEGNYKLLVKHPMYLQRLTNVNLTSNQSATVPELLAGDVNNDNNVNIFDLGIFGGTYNLSNGDENYDSRGDFDKNNTVNIFDLSLLAGNYSLTGDTQND